MQATNPLIRFSLQRTVSRASAGFVAIAAALLGLFPVTGAAQNSDLAVLLYPSPLDTFVNDWMPFTVTVSNLGPYTMSSVSVPCVLPAGVSFINVSPASQSYTVTNNTVTLSFSSLTNLETRSVGIRAKPTSSGTFTFSASISAPGNTDPNSANNSASISVNVGNYLSGLVTASIVSTQWFDAQNGFIEQWIQVSNSGPSSVVSSRVVVTGLTTNWLFNACGTNNGNPFVMYPSKLNPGKTGNLLFQFVVTNRTAFPFTNSQMQAYEIPMPALLPPANLGTPIPSQSVTRISSAGALPGAVLIFFPSVVGRGYTVAYSDNPQFANPLFSPQTIVAQATQTEWIDFGPPATVSYPTNTVTRYYRVYLNP